MEICQENRDFSTETCILMGLGRLCVEQGDLQKAREQLFKSLQNWQNLYPVWNCRFIFEALAILEAVSGNCRKAACLLGFTESAHQRFQRVRAPREREMREKTIRDVRAALGEEAFIAAWKVGERMDVKQALMYVREE